MMFLASFPVIEIFDLVAHHLVCSSLTSEDHSIHGLRNCFKFPSLKKPLNMSIPWTISYFEYVEGSITASLFLVETPVGVTGDRKAAGTGLTDILDMIPVSLFLTALATQLGI
jgi:hypothetical protein